jgi:hypothetical protein
MSLNLAFLWSRLSSSREIQFDYAIAVFARTQEIRFTSVGTDAERTMDGISIANRNRSFARSP